MWCSLSFKTVYLQRVICVFLYGKFLKLILHNFLVLAGMCFSNEPMLVIPDEFGVRLEDHFYMTDDGPRWFTQPSHSIDDPFGLNS